MATNTLSLSNVTKIYDDGRGILAVDDLSLTIEEGEFLVFVGPSGCGKSTTLRMIAGLETATDGEIRLAETDITDRRPNDRNIAMVFQNYALYPHMTVRENISFGLKMSTTLSNDEIDRQVTSTAELMGISDLLDKKPGELSGGQQQRVALGRAIVRKPAVFLMDEPLSNLDAKLRTEMRIELQNLQENLNVTTVYVTHDQTEAMTMGDRIAILNDGQLQQIGTPLECYHQPANQFVAGFIGSPSMNFFEVTHRDNELVHDGFRYTLPAAAASVVAGESATVLGIRPEDIKVVDAGNDNAISATVSVVEPTGDANHVYLDIGGQRVVASLPGDQVIHSGETLHVDFPGCKIHLFDRENGRALHTREAPTDEADLQV
nr:sn-glycerol-3-phosphate ABC transporter ATP-binding protein UgpC [Halogranum salarium]